MPCLQVSVAVCGDGMLQRKPKGTLGGACSRQEGPAQPSASRPASCRSPAPEPTCDAAAHDAHPLLGRGRLAADIGAHRVTQWETADHREGRCESARDGFGDRRQTPASGATARTFQCPRARSYGWRQQFSGQIGVMLCSLSRPQHGMGFPISVSANAGVLSLDPNVHAYNGARPALDILLFQQCLSSGSLGGLPRHTAAAGDAPDGFA